MTTSDKYNSFVLPTYGRFPLVPARAKGTELWDESGSRYLDFCTGIAVCSLGHAHPAIVETVNMQASKLMHCSNLYQIKEQADLAELIIESCVEKPGKVFFSNSGAEANDGLIKSARRYGHAKPNKLGQPRFEILSFKNSFHGRTMGSMFATGQDVVHDRFSPIPQGYRYATYNQIEGMEASISDETVAILLEPIQGEGGVNVAELAFLNEVERLCEKYDLLLLIDEVQAGFGRCGDMMGWRRIAPQLNVDGISWAKGMGGGIPIGAFYLSERVIDTEGTTLSSLMGPKSHGSTYGGNPLSCAVSLTCINTILSEDLCEKANEHEKYLKRCFEQLASPAIKNLDGLGLLLGIKLENSAFKNNSAEFAPVALQLCQKLMNFGVLTVPAGAETLRLLPPLTVSRIEIDEVLEKIQKALAELV